MSENTLLGVAAIGAVVVGGLIAWRMTDPNRQRVPYAPAQPVVPPSSQPISTPTPQTPTITKGQLCADLKAKLQKLQSAADDVKKKMNDLVAKGSSADTNCWSYAKREACFWEICSPALGGNYNACMDYVKGQGPRPGNLFNYDDSRAVDQAAQQYAALKDELETYQAQIEGVKKQLQQLATEGVVC
ncbi:hypothetical protein KQ693_04825 [Thermus sp. PS18]|uniref:hypothetical protein n=1 Tax=Thermus sp. PS18 TaxID=2849039 RepID=UPI002263DC40|nr:hypothetical protein [Thermus sp. PS18]UZX16353.1 hypothetical protein KQ693_04825 [Thermus sp. PS18]